MRKRRLQKESLIFQQDSDLWPLQYLFSALTNWAARPELGKQATFNGPSMPLRYTTIIENEFVLWCKQWRWMHDCRGYVWSLGPVFMEACGSRYSRYKDNFADLFIYPVELLQLIQTYLLSCQLRHQIVEF